MSTASSRTGKRSADIGTDAMPDTTGTENAAAKASTTARKQPPPEKPSDIRTRTWVVISFWLLVVFLGLPIWWHTTTIYRANLPLDEMLEWADGKVCTCLILPSHRYSNTSHR